MSLFGPGRGLSRKYLVMREANLPGPSASTSAKDGSSSSPFKLARSFWLIIMDGGREESRAVWVLRASADGWRVNGSSSFEPTAFEVP